MIHPVVCVPGATRRTRHTHTTGPKSHAAKYRLRTQENHK